MSQFNWICCFTTTTTKQLIVSLQSLWVIVVFNEKIASKRVVQWAHICIGIESGSSACNSNATKPNQTGKVKPNLGFAIGSRACLLNKRVSATSEPKIRPASKRSDKQSVACCVQNKPNQIGISNEIKTLNCECDIATLRQPSNWITT